MAATMYIPVYIDIVFFQKKRLENLTKNKKKLNNPCAQSPM